MKISRSKVAEQLQSTSGGGGFYPPLGVKTVDVGDDCVECGKSTSFGSGLFVNRVPADNGHKSGYMCAECLCPEKCFGCDVVPPIEDEMFCKECMNE